LDGSVRAVGFSLKIGTKRRENMLSEIRYVGLDAGRDTIEASVRPTGEVWRLDTCEASMTQMAENISRIQPQLVVMQANGNFELPLAGILVTFGLPVALVQPRNVRDFARAIGKSSLEHRPQSGILAQFAELVQPESTPMPDDQIEELKQLRERRREIRQMIAEERGRISIAVPAVEKDIQSHIQFLERGLALLDAQFSRKVRVSRIWR
jgi:transposase